MTRVVVDSIVEYHDVQRVRQQPLVLMDPLDLAVKDRVGIDKMTGGPLEPDNNA